MSKLEEAITELQSKQTVTLDDVMKEIKINNYYLNYINRTDDIQIGSVESILSKYFPIKINIDKIQGKEIEKLTSEDFNDCNSHFDKINEIIDRANELSKKLLDK